MRGIVTAQAEMPHRKPPQAAIPGLPKTRASPAPPRPGPSMIC